MTEYYYRLYYASEGRGIRIERWHVEAETERTVVISNGHSSRRVLKDPRGKRFAYADMKDALGSFIIRKQRQRSRLQSTLADVTICLAHLEKYPNLLDELRREATEPGLFWRGVQFVQEEDPFI